MRISWIWLGSGKLYFVVDNATGRSMRSAMAPNRFEAQVLPMSPE